MKFVRSLWVLRIRWNEIGITVVRMDAMGEWRVVLEQNGSGRNGCVRVIIVNQESTIGFLWIVEYT
jgi:hypothetical protein